MALGSEASAFVFSLCQPACVDLCVLTWSLCVSLCVHLRLHVCDSRVLEYACVHPIFICPAAYMPANYVLSVCDPSHLLHLPESHDPSPFLTSELCLHSSPEYNLPSTFVKQDRESFKHFMTSSFLLDFGSVPRRKRGTTGERGKGRIAEEDKFHLHQRNKELLNQQKIILAEGMQNKLVCEGRMLRRDVSKRR